MYTCSKALFLSTVAVLGVAPMRVLAQIAPTPYAPSPMPVAVSPANSTSEGSENEPRAVIRGWSLGSELAPTVVGTDHEVRLDSKVSDVVFFFDAAAPPKQATPIEYRYRLTDYDGDWTTTRDHIAHYRHLRPGHYRFEVQAHTPGQAWSTPVAGLPIEQMPFFYQTWYFYALLLLGISALTIELLRQRDQLLKGQIGMVLEERNRIASDCHDTLMAGFAAISWQLEATARLLAGSDDKSRRAAQSCELARKMVTHCQADARRIIWDLRDSDEITDILSNAVSRALSAMCPRENPEISFAVEGDEIPIAPTAVHHLVCIGQEAVTNAIRHSGCSIVQVHLVYDSDSLNLTVRDNGHGFCFPDPGGRNGHFGILGMQERSRKLGGEFRLDTFPGAGTQISLKVGFRTIHPLSDQQQHVVPWIGV